MVRSLPLSGGTGSLWCVPLALRRSGWGVFVLGRVNSGFWPPAIHVADGLFCGHRPSSDASLVRATKISSNPRDRVATEVDAPAHSRIDLGVSGVKCGTTIRHSWGSFSSTAVSGSSIVSGGSDESD